MSREVMYVLLSKIVQKTDDIKPDKIVKHKYIDFQPKLSVILNNDKIYSEVYELIKEYINPDYYIYLLFSSDVKHNRANKFKFYFNLKESRFDFVGVLFNSQKLLSDYKPRLRLSKV
jgi:hypothetical protein